MEQPGSEFSEEEKTAFEFRSESNDICSNVADLTENEIWIRSQFGFTEEI